MCTNSPETVASATAGPPSLPEASISAPASAAWALPAAADTDITFF